MVTHAKSLNGNEQGSSEVREHDVPARTFEDLPLSQQEYEALKGGFLTRRDLLICKCLRATGLRLSEVLRWRVQDFEHQGPDLYVWVQRGKKAGKPKWEAVAVKRELAIEIADWCRANTHAKTDPVFQGRYPGNPVTRVQVWSAFRDAGVRTIGRPVHPHQLRSLYISHAIEAGVAVPVVSKQVGHASERTTQAHYHKRTLEQRRTFAEQVPV